MDWLFARATVIGIAVGGGVLAVLAMALQKRPERAQLARHLNITSYLLMGTSMLLFILAGLRGANG
jgi:predicted membrane channel-forming protein YqfA (hemolysin III family)